MAQIRGKETLGNIIEEGARVQASMLKDDYESYEFTVPGGGYSDTSLVTAAPAAFSSIIRAHTVIIRSSVDITFKFNSTSKGAISLSAGEGSFSINALEVTAIFFTAAAGAQIKVLLI